MTVGDPVIESEETTEETVTACDLTKVTKRYEYKVHRQITYCGEDQAAEEEEDPDYVVFEPED